VGSAESAASVVAEALAATLAGRPRPAYVEVPFDLLSQPGRPARAPGSHHPRAPDPGEVATAAGALAGAERVVVLAGSGVIQARAGEPLLRVARRLAAPVLTTFMGAGAIPDRDPLAVGLPPAEPMVEDLLRSADALLAVGTSFRGTVTMNGALEVPASVIQLDIDPVEIGKAYPALGIVGDAAASLDALDAELAGLGVDRSDRAAAVGAEIATLRRAAWDELASDPRSTGAVAFLRALRAGLPPAGVVVADMCVAGYWCGGYLPLPGPRRLFYPVGWGTLGCGLPAAVGAAAARQGPVVAVLGDAGFLYYPAELATAREQGLDLVVIVVNDEGYGMLRVGEEITYGRTFAADLLTPDFATLAAAFDVPYASAAIEDGSLEPAISAAVEAGGQRMIEVRAALYPPRSTSPRWPKRDPR
jgi:acetolactate synthase-1/2/3 large subunit